MPISAAGSIVQQLRNVPNGTKNIWNKPTRDEANTVSSGDLVSYSPKDRPWDVHRYQADEVSGAYGETPEFTRLSQRLSECSGRLDFHWTLPDDNGETRLKLARAEFCRARHCPICQWRRSLMWQARFLKALPEIEAKYPKARWIFLTLTVRNCSIHDLRSTIEVMNRGWKRLIEKRRRKDRSDHTRHGWPALGFVRTTEVTRADDGSAHPHFHVLLMVPPSYFAKGYISQADWTQLWKDAAKLNYTPVVNIKAVKPKKAYKHGANTENSSQGLSDALRGAVAETLKYSVKPNDMSADPAWLAELTRQLHKLRFIAAGGALRDFLKDGSDSEEDFVNVDGTDNQETEHVDAISFEWNRPVQRYRKII